MYNLSTKKIPIILDTDIGMDIDDTWALGFLLNSPELNVKLITTASDNTTEKAKLVAKFLENAGRADIPIGIGPSQNSKKGNLFKWIEDYELSHYPGKIYENGIEVLCSTILQAPDPITLIAIGPLGNIAEALKKNPNITENARYVGMQGSIRIGYFQKPSPQPEYNIIKNIEACKEVFEAPWEKTITPLDTCGSIVLEREDFNRFMKSESNIATLVKENFEIWVKKTRASKWTIEKQQTSVLYDTVAIYLGFSEELLNIEELNIEVTEKGLTQVNKQGNKIRCATSWKDLQRFKDFLVNRLII